MCAIAKYISYIRAYVLYECNITKKIYKSEYHVRIEFTRFYCFFYLM